MARSDGSTRIGASERSAAQQALQEHLNAGRLHVNEYADRSATAAEAMTASEVRALFTDLPAPHPKLPGSPLGGARRNLVILAVAAVLVLAGVLALGIGSGGPEPSPSPGPAALPTPNVAPTADPVAPPEASTTPSFAAPNASTGANAGVLPGGATERRTTEGVAITLRPSYGVDLDDDTTQNWNVGRGCCNRDVTLNSDASELKSTTTTPG